MRSERGCAGCGNIGTLHRAVFKALYASSPLLMSSNQSIGSIAKWVVIVAALAEGYRPGDALCPKSARDGDRPLKRAAAPEFGFENCESGRHLMTWERATATSDDLAYYQLAQRLGTERLAAAATVLGLGEPANNNKLAYEVSFGTYGAKPRDLISAFQALVAVAYGIETTGHAPRALRNASPDENPAVKALKRLLPRQEQRDDLRRLLEAPVQSVGGTLAFLKRGDGGEDRDSPKRSKRPQRTPIQPWQMGGDLSARKGIIESSFRGIPCRQCHLHNTILAPAFAEAHIQVLHQS